MRLLSSLPGHVLIIGTGRIGAGIPGLDGNNLDNSIFLSHAQAFSQSTAFQIAGVYDTNPEVAQYASEKWVTRSFDTLDAALHSAPENKLVDMAVVATPDATHETLLRVLLDYPLKLVFCEKPLTTAPDSAQALLRDYEKRGIALAVNYTRRYVPEFEQLACRIQNKEFGSYLGGIGYYGKGLFHNGSHLLDQALMFLGALNVVVLTGHTGDYREADPSLSAVLKTENDRPFYLQAIDCRLYTHYELDLSFEKGRIRIHDLGRQVDISIPKPDPQFGDYRTLLVTEYLRTSVERALVHAVGNLADHLSEGLPLKCPGQTAWQVLSLCDQIHRCVLTQIPR